MNTILISFIATLTLFALVGVASVLKSRKSTEDYLLAGRSVGPGLIALSTMGTTFSGYMFIGVVGFGYAYGISSVWLSATFIIGDYLAWKLIYRRIRERSEAENSTTVSNFVGKTNKKESAALTKFAAVLTLVFLAVYGAAQLKAGSKALHGMLGLDPSTGAIIGAGIVVVYCFAGGIRASIWTDAVQSVVMVAAMILTLGTAVNTVGGPGALLMRLEAIDPQLVELFPRDLDFGVLPYMLGWAICGFGVIGQPHIVVRPMAIRSVKELDKARRTYFGTAIPFTVATVLVSLYARAILPSVAGFDPELALPTIAAEMLPGALAGVVLAGIFAATMSTADSQILSCSAALTQDLAPRWGRGYYRAKAGTLLITGLCLTIALLAPAGVFQLVLVAWSILGVSLGPLVLLKVTGRQLEPSAAIAMCLSGIATVLGWRALGLHDSCYELLPGLAVAAATYMLLRTVKRPSTVRPPSVIRPLQRLNSEF